MLRESKEPDDVQSAMREARELFAAEPAELRIIERLYYSNTAIALDDFADAYLFDPPARSVVQAVGQACRSVSTAERWTKS